MSDHTRKRFQGGVITPEEFHAKYAFPPGSECLICKKPPLTRIRVLMPVDELRKRDPDFDMIAGINPEAIANMLVQTKSGPYIIVTTAMACKQCTPEAEKTAAKHAPSWAIVEISRGPGPDKLVVGGGSNLPT